MSSELVEGLQALKQELELYASQPSELSKLGPFTTSKEAYEAGKIDGTIELANKLLYLYFGGS